MAEFYQNGSSLGLVGGTLNDAWHSLIRPKWANQIKLARYQLLFNAYYAQGRCAPLTPDS